MRILVPTLDGELPIEIEPGKPAVLLGPNGSGKSRLGIFIDDLDESGASHRIAAQRSLELPDDIFLESFDQAIVTFRRDKTNKRRRKPSPGTMEYAYHEMLTALFAEHHRVLEDAHNSSSKKLKYKRPITLIDRLQKIWNDLIPHQQLIFSERTVRAVQSFRDNKSFVGSEMSDGERLIVYIIGQTLLIEINGLLIVDEPELHMSRALLVRLWDVVEKSRPDCSFIYITHDVDFAASRVGARMYAVLEFQPPTFKEVIIRRKAQIVEDVPPKWKLVSLPSGTDLPNELLVRIVGSRKPILFVEGRITGLDYIVYKTVYDNFTVIPAESCGQVIQYVRSFRGQRPLHWLHCAGIVDMDFRSTASDGRIDEDLYALPVTEIENLFLVKEVFIALAESLLICCEDSELRFDALELEVLEWASLQTERMSLKRTSNRIWKESSSIGIKAKNIDDLANSYKKTFERMDVKSIYRDVLVEYELLISDKNYRGILENYDSKGGLFDKLAKRLGLRDRNAIEAFISRILCHENNSGLINALRSNLPVIKVQP